MGESTSSLEAGLTACGHDAGELRMAAAEMSAASEDLERAKSALVRAEGIPWSGAAASAFRTSTFALTLQLGLVASSLAGLAIALSSIQAETSVCPGAAAGAPTLPLFRDTATPLLPGRSTPLLPLAAPAPVLPQAAPTPSSARHSDTPPASWEACR